MYSDIERNDTRNFREKKIFVLLFLELWKWSVLITYYILFVYILYIVCLYIIYSCIIYIYNMLFCFSSFSLMFYGINFLRPTSSSFLYLVSKGRSAEPIEWDNSVSFHHAIYAHQYRNQKKDGINSFPFSISKSIGTKPNF